MNPNRYLTKQNILKMLYESALIIFSVLLALFLNEYISQQKQDKIKKEALQKVMEELRSNSEIVKEWYMYHQTVLKNLNDAVDNESYRKGMIIGGQINYWNSLMPKGIIQKLIEDTAWLSFKASSVFSDLEFETMFKFAKLYKLQSLGVESTVQKIVDIISSRDAIAKDKLSETLMLLKNAFNELVSQEEFLLHNYNETLAELNTD